MCTIIRHADSGNFEVVYKDIKPLVNEHSSYMYINLSDQDIRAIEDLTHNVQESLNKILGKYWYIN